MSYRFGDFILDYDTRQLLLDGDEIHLSPKAFELLVILIVNRPRVVSKAELQEKLWPSTFVEETNLAGLVAEIRRALRDAATRPTFVRTVYRFGYSFTGDVVESAAAIRSVPSPARPCLVYEHRQILLMQGDNVIGRAPDATIQCDAAGVSRHHARILVSNSEATLEDLDSKNGTFLKRKRITSAPLSDGDEIRVGTVSLIFRSTPAMGPTDSVPEDPDDESTGES
ncbi:MAG TPA: FHA domain-containing protein [Vicinamibacterales bacterium]|nr:FHA domain-containing protein [Vicinamibacterales bacterium]